MVCTRAMCLHRSEGSRLFISAVIESTVPFNLGRMGRSVLRLHVSEEVKI